MAVGSKYWAESFVITTSGKKLYLSTTMYDLEEQMRSRKTTIEVTISSLISTKTIVLYKKNIESYGRYNMFQKIEKRDIGQ